MKNKNDIFENVFKHQLLLQANLYFRKNKKSRGWMHSTGRVLIGMKTFFLSDRIILVVVLYL